MRTMMVPGRVAVIPGGVGIDRPLDRPVGCPHGDPGGAHAAARCGFDFDRDTRNSKATGQTREPLAGRTGVHQRAKEHVAADTRHGVDDGERMAGHGLEYHPLLWWRQFGRITIEPPRARIEKDDSLLRSQHTSFPEQPGRRDRSAAFRREINALEPAAFARLAGEVLVVDHDRAAAALAQRAEHEPVAERPGHPEAAGDGPGIGPRIAMVGAGLERLDDGGAAFGLDREHPRQPAFDPSRGAELLEDLPHPDEAGAAAGGIQDRVRQRPAEALRDLEAEGLLPFDPVRLPEGREGEGADYPFTTLEPHLGVVGLSDHRSFVVADIPGIIEGAHEGKGLGLRFLQHVERTRILAVLVPMDSPDPQATYELLRKEAAAYSEELAAKPHVVVLTKADLAAPDAARRTPLRTNGAPIVEISAVARQGITELLEVLWKTLKS